MFTEDQILSKIRWNKRNLSRAARLELNAQLGVVCDPPHDFTGTTLQAVVDFQAEARLDPDGLVGTKTRRALERRMRPATASGHMLPRLDYKWGYHHAIPESVTRVPADMKLRDPELRDLTSSGSWLAGMLRLVSGYKPSRDVFSRGLDSYISLDTYSIGIAHWWASTAPKLISKVVRAAPGAAEAAWGARVAQAMRDPAWLRRQIPPKRGHMRHDPDNDWFLAGWWQIARDRIAVRVQIETWAKTYVNKAYRLADQYDFDLGTDDGGKILAGLARMCNSSTSIARRSIKTGRKLKPHADQLEQLKAGFHTSRSDGGYGKPKRWKVISSWEEFEGPAPSELVFDSLNWNYERLPARR